MEPSVQPSSGSQREVRKGSLDGTGAADHDQPFQFGSRPTSAWPVPFTPRQFARLLIVRGRAQDGEFDDDSLIKPAHPESVEG